MEMVSTKPQLRVLLDHLGTIKDTRQPWKVAYPLREVLFLVVCGTIACGDDYDDIVDWGEAHLSFLRRFCEFHHGIPCSWVAECWPDKPDLVSSV
jgi:hypothetical protein